MLLRYVPVLERMGAAITLLVPPPLVRFAQQQLGVDVYSDIPKNLSGFDYRCPLFSVIANLQHDVSDIPPPLHVALGGCQTLDFTRGGCSIGIAWSGNRAHLRDKHRSLEVGEFLSLLDIYDRSFYSVQNSEQDQALSRGVEAPTYINFFDTVMFMMSLDHIVTVDTAAAHLAGTIGHPSVHVLVPYSSDWRWYNAQVWYPGINVYRQDSSGDWPSAFLKVNKCLKLNG
jgi:hypothetical protein